MKKIIILALLTATTYAGQSCWSTSDKLDNALSELDEKITFSLKDAEDCQPVQGATVNILGEEYKTDSMGKFVVPIPPEDLDMDIDLKVSHQNYFTLKQGVRVALGSFWNTRFSMSKKLAKNNIRYILNWNEKPSDLDLHLKGNGMHVSYRNAKTENGTFLDRDSTNGYGPETITQKKANLREKYIIYVHKYSNDGLINGKANLTIYADGTMMQNIRLKSTHDKCLKVAVVENGNITVFNQVVSDSMCVN